MRKKKNRKRKQKRGLLFQYSYLHEEINRLKNLLKNCKDSKESTRIRELLDILKEDRNVKEKYSKRKRFKKF